MGTILLVPVLTTYAANHEPPQAAASHRRLSQQTEGDRCQTRLWCPHRLYRAVVGGGVAKTKNFIVGRSGSAVFLLYFVHELR
jgi:hypothetical protein